MGSREVVLNRSMSELAAVHPVSKGLFRWMRHMGVPDESYFPTMARIKVDGLGKVEQVCIKSAWSDCHKLQGHFFGRSFILPSWAYPDWRTVGAFGLATPSGGRRRDWPAGADHVLGATSALSATSACRTSSAWPSWARGTRRRSSPTSSTLTRTLSPSAAGWNSWPREIEGEEEDPLGYHAETLLN